MTIRIFIAAIILFAASVYLWGGIALDPESLELALSDPAHFGQYGFSLNPYINILVIALLTAGVLLYAFKPRFKLPRLSRNTLIGLGIFSLTIFYPRLPLTGWNGILISLIIILQNLLAICGLILLSPLIAGFLENKSFPSLKSGVDRPLFIPAIIALYILFIYCFSRIVFGAIPHVGDEQVQLWGAKILASGHFTVPVPRRIEFFFDPFMIAKDGRWFTQYPAGFQMLLVPFVLLNHPEWLNPLLAGLTLYIFIKLCKELNLSKWWGFLFALSPFVIFMSASQMNHPASLLFGTLGLYAFLKSERSKAGWLFLWGLSAGFMFTVRPFTAVCFHFPLAIFAIRKKVGLGVLTAIVGGVLGSAPYFIMNYYTIGSPFTSGYQAAWDGASGLFFGQSPWGPPHTPQFGLLHLFLLLNGLNMRLFEFPIPALTGVVLWVIFRLKKYWKEWALLTAGLTSLAGYYFYFYVDLAYGPRFAYDAVVPMLLLTALGIKSLYRKLRDGGWTRAKVSWTFTTAGAILAISWMLISLPARWNYFSDSYRETDKNFIKFIRKQNIHNAIVFLPDFPSSNRHTRLYSLGFTNRQAWYYANGLNDKAVYKALYECGISVQDGFSPCSKLNELGMALNKFWGNPEFLPDPYEDMQARFIPLTQGLIYMSPYIDKNDIIYARDFYEHNIVLMNEFPEKRYYWIYFIYDSINIMEMNRDSYSKAKFLSNPEL